MLQIQNNNHIHLRIIMQGAHLCSERAMTEYLSFPSEENYNRVQEARAAADAASSAYIGSLIQDTLPTEGV